MAHAAQSFCARGLERCIADVSLISGFVPKPIKLTMSARPLASLDGGRASRAATRALQTTLWPRQQRYSYETAIDPMTMFPTDRKSIDYMGLHSSA